MQVEAVDAALVPITRTLEADGYTLGVQVAGDALALRVIAGPDACEECLVPKSLMTALIEQALGDAGLPVPAERISLTYPTDPS